MNRYCEQLEISPPDLAATWNHRKAGPFRWIVLALLERGSPVRLEDLAARLADLGAGDGETLLTRMKKSRPNRPPLYELEDA